MDSLIELPVDKWPILQANLKLNWPINVAGFYALNLNAENYEIRESFQFKVYCPYGETDNGFVATSLKGEVDCIIFTTPGNTEKMEQALKTTKIIDWSRKVCIDLVTPDTLKMLTKMKESFKTHYFVGILRTYYLDHESKPFKHVKCPPGTKVAPVKLGHVQRVDDVWPYKHPGSYTYFSTLASSSLSYGLYSNDNELRAWVFINEYNFLCHLYCEEAHRRNGYGEYLMKCAVNDQLRLGNDLYAYVLEGNVSSSRLFLKLGFADIGDGAYLYVQRG